MPHQFQVPLPSNQGLHVLARFGRLGQATCSMVLYAAIKGLLDDKDLVLCRHWLP